jgi:hypothetical protein
VLKEATDAGAVWMRPVSFGSLLRTLVIVGEHPNGLRATELDILALQRGVHARPNDRSGRDRRAPSRTTLYHYRNTLIKLGAVCSSRGHLIANRDNPYVVGLLNESADAGLTAMGKELWASLVLQNETCALWFFRLFGVDALRIRSAAMFRASATAVIWNAKPGSGSRVVTLTSGCGDSVALRSPSEVKGVLYGVRYWARDELQLVDEYFREDRGNILYPVQTAIGVDPRQIASEIVGLGEKSGEWAVIGVTDLIAELGESRRYPLWAIFAGIRWLLEMHGDAVVPIATSRRMATLTAASPVREELELRRYYRDAQSRYISHIRLHESVVV